MEDAHAHVLSLGEPTEDGKKTSFFAVYDGHGGTSVSQSFCGTHDAPQPPSPLPPLASSSLATRLSALRPETAPGVGLTGIGKVVVGTHSLTFVLLLSLARSLPSAPNPSSRPPSRLDRRKIRRRHGAPSTRGQQPVQEPGPRSSHEARVPRNRRRLASQYVLCDHFGPAPQQQQRLACLRRGAALRHARDLSCFFHAPLTLVSLCCSLFTDPDFRGDPSGCTAVSALFTEDLKIICVRPCSGYPCPLVRSAVR